jgi:hypothetical protein
MNVTPEGLSGTFSESTVRVKAMQSTGSKAGTLHSDGSCENSGYCGNQIETRLSASLTFFPGTAETVLGQGLLIQFRWNFFFTADRGQWCS